MDSAVLEARDRVDALLASVMPAQDEDSSTGTLEEWLKKKDGEMRFTCFWTDQSESRVREDYDTSIDDNLLVVEDLDGRQFLGKLRLAKAVQEADRSLSTDAIRDLVRVLRNVAVFAIKQRDPVFFFKAENEKEEARLCLRVGITNWVPDFYGLGVEACVLRRCLQVDNDEKILCAASSTRFPLRTNTQKDNDQDIFYDDLASRVIGNQPIPPSRLDFWWLQDDVLKDTAHIPNTTNSRKYNKKATFSKLMAWGENPRNCLGTNETSLVPSPLALLLPDAERGVIAIACSARHTLVLTQSRCLYACGDNEDGACGVDATYAVVPRLTAVDWPDQEDVPIAIAAASDVFGAHSAAIGASSKKLYAWGQGVASGQRGMAPVRKPERMTVRFEPGETEESQFVSVSCGGSFGVALDFHGRAWAWGVWAEGRLGLGEAPLLSQQSKRRAAYQLLPRRQHTPPEPWLQLVAGEAHVLAIAVSGRLYSWGRNSHGELGRSSNNTFSPVRVDFAGDDTVRMVTAACGASHSVAVDTEGRVWAWGHKAAADILSSTTEFMSRRVLSNNSQEQLHALPHLLLEKPAVKAVACGERHTAMITSDDEALLVCGDGLATIASSSETAERLTDEASSNDEESLAVAAHKLSVVRTPRRPSAAWLSELEASRIELLACGGQHTIALVAPAAGELIGRKLLLAAREASETVLVDNRVDDEALASLRAMGFDCVIIPGGGAPLCAHLMILAQRCAHLAELITLERREDGDDAPVLQLLLPELSPLCADALLEYLYCDDIPRQREFRLLYELHETAQRYNLPRLESMCTLLQGTSALMEIEPELPASTLTEELVALVDQEAFADVRIVASEGTTIHAHRAILVLSDYFRAMFASGMRETIEVRVPDPAATVRRMLHFLYAGVLPAGDTGQLLEDLVAADRYGLDRMKRACESAIMARGFLIPDEALATYRICEHLDAPALKEYALSFFLNHLDQPSVNDILHQLLSECKEEKSTSVQVMDSLHSERSHLSLPPTLPADIINMKDEEDEEDSAITIRPNNLHLSHAIALGVLSLFCLWLQQFFRLKKYAVATLNTMFLFVFIFVFWHNRHLDTLLDDTLSDHEPALPHSSSSLSSSSSARRSSLTSTTRRSHHEHVE